MASLESEKPPGGLSLEETDNLARSNKKAKMDQNEEVETAPVTEMMEINDQSQQTMVLETQMDSQGKPLFATATDTTLTRKLLSYKDAILGGSEDEISAESDQGANDSDDSSEGSSSTDEMDEEESEEPEGEQVDEGDIMCPTVHVSSRKFHEACKPWKSAVIIKVLGKRVGLKFLHLRLLKMWPTLGDMELIDLEFDYFLVRFSNPSDVNMVFEQGPWLISGHYLVIQNWQPHLFPGEDELKRVAVWVRIPGLPMEFYDREILGKIGNVLGKTMRVDSNTLKPRDGYWGQTTTERGKFARLCVEINLQKPLIPQFRLMGRTYKVEYEGLFMVCFACGRYGHRHDSCPEQKMEEQVQQDSGVAEEQPGDCQAGGSGKGGDKNDIFGPGCLCRDNLARDKSRARK
ncbi:Zinc finger, CCHC-type [Sesbania bispinosa]|nr:Zinc finger, CCHC-type [Sesbania bispinosa]